MVRSISVADDGVYVLLCRIAHIPFPSVLRVLGRKFPHIFVPVCLCQHRCRGDGRELGVTLHHALVLIAVERLEPVSVYQQIFRLDIQSAHSPLHSGDGCIQYVYGVYLFCTYLFDCPRDGLLLYHRTEQFPCLFGHLLGVIQQRVIEVLRQDHGCRKDRSGQRAASGFVAACLYQVCIEIA